MIRNAILQAANHIQIRPVEYCFLSSARPEPCGTAGCAIGWIGYFLGIQGPSDSDQEDPLYLERVLKILGVSQGEFYDRMDSYGYDPSFRETWTRNATVCAAGLRRYADEFFPIMVA